MVNTNDDAYRSGLDAEAEIAVRIGEAFPAYRLVKSNVVEDKQQDIDYWLIAKDNPSKRYSLSIKNQLTAGRTGRVLFELEVLTIIKEDSFNRLPDNIEIGTPLEPGITFDGWVGKRTSERYFVWKQSTFYKSKAYAFVIWTGKSLLVVNTAKLRAYISEHGWMANVRLGDKAKKSQARIGHPHMDAKCGLLQIKRLLQLNLAMEVK